MSDEQCVHEMTKKHCALCGAKEQIFFDAIYRGICMTCGRDINPGERVKWVLDETGVEHARHGRS